MHNQTATAIPDPKINPNASIYNSIWYTTFLFMSRIFQVIQVTLHSYLYQGLVPMGFHLIQFNFNVNKMMIDHLIRAKRCLKDPQGIC